MENIYLSKDEVKQLEPYRKKDGFNEGMIYKHQKYLYKLFNGKAIEKEPLIDILMQIGEVSHCVMPNNKIYVEDKFAGICIDRCVGFKTFNKTLDDDKIDFRTRLVLCRQLIDALKNLYQLGIGYDDVNLKNVMTDKNNIQLIDMDGSSAKQLTTKEEFELIKHLLQFNSSIVILSYLYGVNFEKMICRNSIDFFKSLLSLFTFDEEMKQYLYSLVSEKNVGNIFIDQYLAGITEDNVKDDKNGFIKYFLK